MRAWTWVTVVGMCLAGWQAMAQELDERKAEGKLSLRLTDEVISKAVRETLAEQPAGPRIRSDKALSGDAYQKFEWAFSEAEKPGCLNPNALKFQPASTVIGGHGGGGWNVGVTGLLALPFWAAAVVRGKCK
ncbi:hypothetical protein SRABI118_02576 [Massilia sp. Bi118]|uniref:hypothetical protein n=1 Tax=Massilia sp. Bi118 TaxID=2822346 RepID=UPI001DDB80E3|nr:hypothetical protein [Massilia sp. Bi118]CAH0235297.1 hypothetical protein SRABI118_02576 [Massilia sp. Bi118]